MTRSATLHRIEMPMKKAFGHARATRALAESVVLRIADDGVEGVGECVARDYVTGETPATVFAAISSFDLEPAFAAAARGSFDEAVRAVEALDLRTRLARGERTALAAAACVELALLDLIGRRFSTSITATTTTLQLPEALTAGRGERHQLTRALDTSRAPDQLASEKLLEGFTVLKIKVGLGRDEDLARVRASREIAGPDFVIAVDANMAWSLDEACEMADVLRPYSIAWYEEPLAKGALRDYHALRTRTGARVMLDESLCSFEDAQAAVAESACDLFNIRISKCGGFLTGLRLAELAHQHGLGYQLGTHPGAQGILRAADWSFAHAIAGFATVEAARSNAWFDEEIICEPLKVDYAAGRIVPLTGPGLGITLKPERLEQFTVQRARWDAGAWTI
ncbi:MAG: hypothetical protein H0T42_19735 [Deltaproteobacteria bacterium]|nr:hypothetical protein [Deltaproteobacteria bacterium]